MNQKELNQALEAAALLDERDTGHVSWAAIRLLASIARENGKARWFPHPKDGRRIVYEARMVNEDVCLLGIYYADLEHGEWTSFTYDCVPPELRDGHIRASEIIGIPPS